MRQTDYFGEITYRPIYFLQLDTVSSSRNFTTALPSIELSQAWFSFSRHIHMQDHSAGLLFTESEYIVVSKMYQRKYFLQICFILSFLCKMLPFSPDTKLHSSMALCRLSKSNWRIYRLSHGALNIVHWGFCSVRYCCIS